MRFTHLSIHAVRNIAKASLECHPGCNVIFGRNAAGKTAILEAIYILARASSFRTPRIAEVIQHAQDRLSVLAELVDCNDIAVKTGLEKGRSQTRIRFNGRKINRRSEQAGNIPLFAVTPDSHKLLFGTPRDRRHWLDWSLFHVEQGYIGYWRDYHHALRHRNILLRKGARETQLDPWERALAAAALPVSRSRQSYLACLQEALKPYLTPETAPMTLKNTLAPETPETYQQKLKEGRQSDRLAGHTRYGPHRDDVLFLQGKGNAAAVFSRGQAKQFVVSLILAQAAVYTDLQKASPILLLDDLPAELDDDARQAIVERLQAQKMQAFVTTTSPEILGLRQGTASIALFHVERGEVVKVIE